MDIYQKYSQALETAIGLIQSEKLDPTQALQKTAEIMDLERPGVEYVASQLNNSRALVHMATTSGESRLAPFPLADASKVKTKSDRKPKKAEVCKKAAVDNVFRPLLTNRTKPVRKTASAEPPQVRADPFREFDMVLAEEKDLVESALRLHRAYSEDVKRLRNRCSDTAEAVVHTAGSDDFYQIHRKAPKASRVRVSTEKLASTYETMKIAEHAADGVLHLAGSGFLSDFLSRSAAMSVARLAAPGSSTIAQAGIGDDLHTTNAYKDLGLVDMSPSTAARLSGLRTRRSFMDVVFTDPNLRGYPLPKLIQAFNDSVQTDPSIVKSPPRLRAGMSQMLQSSVLDPFQLGQMVDTGKKQQAIFKEIRAARESAHEDLKKYNSNKLADMVGMETNLAAASKIAKDQAKEENLLRGGLRSTIDGVKALGSIPEMNRSLKRETARVESLLQSYDAADLEAVAKQNGFSDAAQMRRMLLKKVRQNPEVSPVFKDTALDSAVAGVKELQTPAEKAAAEENIKREEARIDRLLNSLDAADLDKLAKEKGFSDASQMRQAMMQTVRDTAGKSPVTGDTAVDSAAKGLRDLKTQEEKARDAELLQREEYRIDRFFKAYTPEELEAVALENGFGSVDEYKNELLRQARENPGKSPISKFDATRAAVSNMEAMDDARNSMAKDRDKVADKVIESKLKAMGKIDRTYLNQAMKLTDEALGNRRFPTSMNELASRALSTLDTASTAEFASKMTEVEALALAMKFADDVAGKARRSGGTKLTRPQLDAIQEVEFRTRLDPTAPIDPTAAGVADNALRQYEGSRLMEEAVKVERQMKVKGSVSQKKAAEAAARQLGMSYAELLSTLAASETPGGVVPSLQHNPSPDAVRQAVDSMIQNGDPLAAEYQDMLRRVPDLIDTVSGDGATVFRKII